MPLSFQCRQCDALFSLPDELAGKLVRCAKCQATYNAPLASDATAIAAVKTVTAAPPSKGDDGIQAAEPKRVHLVNAAPKPSRSERGRPERPKAKGGMSTGLIIGGVAGVAVLLLLCLVGVGAAFIAFPRHKPAPKDFVANPKFDDKDAKHDHDHRVDPPIDDGPGVPPVKIAANPFKAGTQTRLREATKFNAPVAPVQMIYSTERRLLFLQTKEGITVLDNEKSLGTQKPDHTFTDLALSADESALFAADFGGEDVYGNAVKPSFVHRYDLTTRRWERARAPKIAYRIEAVDSKRFLCLELDQWVDITLNRWDNGGNTTELARMGGVYGGDFEYDPRTGRVFHGSTGISSAEITVYRVTGDQVRKVDSTAHTNGGGGTVLSADGSRLYYGKLQVNAANFKDSKNVFPEPILAAGRDIAFGKKTYYSAATAQKLGELPFEAGLVTVSRDSSTVWAFDPAMKMLHQYEIEGER